MTPRRLVRLASLVATISTACLIGVYQGAKFPPTLVAPLAIGEVVAYSDGGSAYFAIHDELGTSVLLGMKGSLDRPRSQFPVVFQRWHGLIPFGRQVAPGSNDEARILMALRSWLSALPETAAYRQGLEELARVLGDRHPKLITTSGA